MAAIIPIKNLSTEDVLYGDRITSYRWEVLEHLVRRNLEDNPRAIAAGSADAFGSRFGWVRSYHTSGAETIPMEFGTLVRFTSSEAASMIGRGVDSYGNMESTLSAGQWAAGPLVSPGQLVTVSRYVRMGSSPNLTGYSSAIRFRDSAGNWVNGRVTGEDVAAVNGQWVRTSVTAMVPEGAERFSAQVRLLGGDGTTSSFVDITALQTEIGVLGTYFDGGTTAATYWDGGTNVSSSFLVPTSDRLLGTLDGVSDGSLRWTQNAAVKGGGKVSVIDLEKAQSGMLRIADLQLESVRVRPVCVIQGLPENPLGIFLVSAAVEEWENTGRVWSLQLLDRCTVPSQDKVDQSYAVAAGTLILQEVRAILATCGEYLAINGSATMATSTGMVWEAGTSKLKIINDLLNVAGYNALWMDGYGNLQVTPRVLPADRSVTYEVLGIPRELRDGEQSIYHPDWSRDRDSFEVPNKVIAVEAAGGNDTAALIGTWTNQDASSPYSYQARGRWIPHVLDSVECPEGTPAEILAFLQKRAQTTLVQMSAVQAQVKIEHLPIPVRVSDVVRFSHAKSGVDARHVITSLDLDTSPLGLMKATLQEVISL